jgi:hypothetical protein
MNKSHVVFVLARIVVQEQDRFRMFLIQHDATPLYGLGCLIEDDVPQILTVSSAVENDRVIVVKSKIFGGEYCFTSTIGKRCNT